MKIKQTAGRDSLGDFAPEFAELNDDVLFGRVWSGDGLSLKMRSILTITVLTSKGLIDSSFAFHLQTAKKNGVTKSEMADILTHIAFYAGWPNAWAAFRMAKEVYAGDAVTIPANVKHWHGAAADGWFSHIAVECPGVNASNEWLEPVTDEQYNSLK